MSLAARNALYFKYTVSARFKLSPAPSSAKEVSFLLRSFQRIAPVDYFHVRQTKFSSSNPFKQIVSVVFNASEQQSQLDPFAYVDENLGSTPARLEQRQYELLSYIRQICGIPRYSYIENDELYSEGKSMVPFIHRLLPAGQSSSGEYEISHSTKESPFFLLTGNRSAAEVAPLIRHNFQRFHKMEALMTGTGPDALENITGTALGTEVKVNMNHVINTASLMNLDEKVPMISEKHLGKTFRGFW